jgi:hydroxyacylglutathione hydrolase
MPHIVRFLPVGPLQCNCVIVGDTDHGEAIVVDPGGDPAMILNLLAEMQLRCVAVVNTHTHLDHVAANASVKRATHAPLFIHEQDKPLYDLLEMQATWLGGMVATPEPAVVDGWLAHGDHVEAGRVLANVLHTPGHTPGSLSLFFENSGQPLLLSGDTLFAGSIGRTDLWGGDYDAEIRSIREHLLRLPDATRVIPGHGDETTVGIERSTNPFLIDL